MKQKIVVYLLLFTALLVIFQYVNSKRIFDDANNRIANYKALVEKQKDSIVMLQHNLLDAMHFNLERNEDAISYFENDGHNIYDLIPHIKDELYELNRVKGEHPIVPYAPLEGRKIVINTIKILNHKWIIADFTDGLYWGEILVAYYVNNNKTVDFKLIESFIYPFD